MCTVHRLGEWLVDLSCIIPIHIAVCRERKSISLWRNGVNLFRGWEDDLYFGADVQPDKVEQALIFGGSDDSGRPKRGIGLINRFFATKRRYGWGTTAEEGRRANPQDGTGPTFQSG